MKLTGQQHKQLREAIQSAFPLEGDLKIMLREAMELSLDNISSGENYNQIVYNLIDYLEAQNRIIELIKAAIKYVPGNQELLNFKQQFIQEPEPEPPATPPKNTSIEAATVDVPDNEKLLNYEHKFIQKVEPKPPPTPPINVSKTWFQALRIITIRSSIITLICIIIGFVGILQPFDLWVFDQLIQLRGSLLPNEPDNRILIVEVTPEEREEWDKVEKPYRASLPDEAILKLLQKLDKYNPKAIGLDIYRPFNATEDELAKRLINDSRLFAVCKVPGEKGNKEAPPPEVSEKRIGFSDFILDPDRVLRRYLFEMDFHPNPDEKKKIGIKEYENFCQANYAISFQLALHYLGEEAQLTEKEFYKIRDVVFKPLERYAGPYQGNIDAGGHQILLEYRNFRGSLENSPGNVAERLTLNQVIQDKVKTKDIQKYQNRIILIGIITRGQEDYWSTPLGSPRVPGLLIQAQMVSQILRAVEDGEPLLWYWQQGIEWLWIWGWATFGGTIVWCNRQLMIPIMGTAGIILLVGICCSVFLFLNGWLPSIAPIMAFIFTSILIFLQKKLSDRSKII
ncbi:MAG: CHASE2 domain-containing protein [Okeania sp. SIO3I5]|uniref:CHASE2 domain-containing protein n=1 Tax=Okeania sp. SIO3I5 TaxID=2607805 RepID=UPI0013B7A4DB|nr:CHASE2 domain-containing protein [Okeania sp. SIO3I5]NEQ39560.1 CHASE2 domain-containing protein [Okeania sp. SIO3I5]